MKNKKVILICIAGITAFVVMLAVALIYLYNYNKPNNSAGQNSRELSRAAASPKVNSEPSKAPENDVITSKTEYALQTYYVNTDSGENLIETDYPVPSELIAMNRLELEAYLDEYLEEMPLNEYLDGLLSFEIISFSGNRVVLRKTYASDWAENDYYLCDVEGEVVVFYGDKDTVYEYTGIMTNDLSADEQIKIRVGYFVANEEELYALLESYSS